MKPINFPQAAKVLQKPSDMTDKECLPLPVWCDGKQCISCWKPTLIERLKILFTGKMWIGVLSGNTQPPIFISGENVFVKPSIKARFCAFLSKLKNYATKVGTRIFRGFIQPDKFLHLLVGFIIAFFIGLINPIIGLVVAILAGIGKEVYDKVSKKGTPEFLDFVFTAIGGILGFATVYILRLFFHYVF